MLVAVLGGAGWVAEERRLLSSSQTRRVLAQHSSGRARPVGCALSPTRLLPTSRVTGGSFFFIFFCVRQHVLFLLFLLLFFKIVFFSFRCLLLFSFLKPKLSGCEMFLSPRFSHMHAQSPSLPCGVRARGRGGGVCGKGGVGKGGECGGKGGGGGWTQVETCLRTFYSPSPFHPRRNPPTPPRPHGWEGRAWAAMLPEHGRFSVVRARSGEVLSEHNDGGVGPGFAYLQPVCCDSAGLVLVHAELHPTWLRR